MDAVPERQSDVPDDAELIARVLAGEKQQFEHIVERYQRTLYRHAMLIVLDHDVAADMVQDAFVRTYLNLRQCRDHSRFRHWLFRTLRNRCLDYLKESRRRNIRLSDVVESPFDEAAGPDALVEQRELRTRMRSALGQLPPALREAFLMHYLDGVPYDAMAEILDASVSALKMRALRARETLKSTLRRTDVTHPPSMSSSYQTR